MNVCTFTGFVTDKPELSVEGGVSVVEFTLVSYTYRRSKATGEKTRIPTFINLEAWHTGAETIEKLVDKGTKMTVYCSARNVSSDDCSVIFRVNEFDICQPEKD
jgi:single-stranded DNA-binding protein